MRITSSVKQFYQLGDSAICNSFCLSHTDSPHFQNYFSQNLSFHPLQWGCFIHLDHFGHTQHSILWYLFKSFKWFFLIAHMKVYSLLLSSAGSDKYLFSPVPHYSTMLKSFTFSMFPFTVYQRFILSLPPLNHPTSKPLICLLSL